MEIKLNHIQPYLIEDVCNLTREKIGSGTPGILTGSCGVVLQDNTDIGIHAAVVTGIVSTCVDVRIQLQRRGIELIDQFHQFLISLVDRDLS